MNRKHRARLVTAAEALTGPKEQVEVVTLAKIGTVPVRRDRTAGAAASVDIALGGSVIAFMHGEAYLVLTTSQVLFFKSHGTAGPGGHFATLARASITPTLLSDGLFVRVNLDIADSDRAIRLTFAPLSPGGRSSGLALVDALDRTAPKPKPKPRFNLTGLLPSG